VLTVVSTARRRSRYGPRSLATRQQIPCVSA